MPETASTATKYLRTSGTRRRPPRLSANPLELLRYRSNLLGADLRITNFGGGNTSSKFTLPDPLTGEPVRVLAVKGSGGDLRSIGASGFAILYLDKLEQLIARYRGEAHEDEMVAFYPLCAFGENRVAASIDTPLHAFLPFDHVDHLHPDWCIALAASANGERKLAEFNARLRPAHRLAAVAAAWLRARHDAAARGGRASRMRRHAARQPRAVHLGRHAARLLREQHQDDRSDGRVRRGSRAGVRAAAFRRAGGDGDRRSRRDRGGAPAAPARRRLVESPRDRALRQDRTMRSTFANSRWAAELCQMGTSCPDHFLRTRICPMFVPWNPARRRRRAACSSASASRSAAIATSTRPTTRRARSRILRRCAIRTRRSS